MTFTETIINNNYSVWGEKAELSFFTALIYIFVYRAEENKIKSIKFIHLYLCDQFLTVFIYIYN